MAPKRITKGTMSQAASSAQAPPPALIETTAKSSVKKVVITNGKVTGNFNFSQWNEKSCMSQMHWGGAAVEEYLMGAGIGNQAEIKEVIDCLKAAGIFQFTSVNPTGLSVVNVIEFYNNSTITEPQEEEGVENSLLNTRVQGYDYELSWEIFAEYFDIPETGEISEVDVEDEDERDGVQEMYSEIRNVDVEVGAPTMFDQPYMRRRMISGAHPGKVCVL